MSSVLIADDEPLARRTLRQHLLDLGWAGPIHETKTVEWRLRSQTTSGLIWCFWTS